MGELLGITAVGAVVLVAAWVWQKRRRAMRYDLRHWNVDPPGEAYDDMVDEDSGPYCVRCDTPNPPGTHFCQSCGQKIT